LGHGQQERFTYHTRQAGATEALVELVRDMRLHLSAQATLGLQWLPKPAQTQETQVEEYSVETLEDIRADLGECKRCRLHQGRRHIVFGEGDPRARIVIVGEGPGYEEDRQGRPFVGAAGKLLDRMIVAMGWQRPEVYIANVIKCHPPGNRNPREDEMATCGPFLKRQIRAIRPTVILTLGGFASQYLLSSRSPISLLRGRVHQFEGIPLIPTYHPAYLLRNPGQKGKAWQDLQLLMKLVDKETVESVQR